MDSPTRRGNYDSGQDYVLEYGELRFTFNERDFSERVEQAALKLGFVAARLEGVELEDLVNLTVNGEVADPASPLGEHVNDCWPELVGPAERSRLGFGAVKLASPPLQRCAFSVEQAFPARHDGQCVNVRFFDLPDTAPDAVRAFDLRDRL